MFSKPLTTRILLALPLVVGAAIGQSDYTGPANLVFTMDNSCVLDAAIGQANNAAIVGDEAILTFAPGVSPFALPLCDFGTWASFFGDEDADGQYFDSIITSVDAVWVPPNAPTPPTLFDTYFSFQVDTGTAGFVGAAIDEADIVRLDRLLGIVTFLSKQQIVDALGFTSTSLDVNGFTVDPATGDIYLTFTATVTVAGATMLDGGIARIPASAYTTQGGPLTPVATVTPNSAEIVMTEAEVNAIFQNADSLGVTDLTGIEIDPTGGTFTSAATGATLPHLWLVDDDETDEMIVSTKANATSGLPGVIPSVNGVFLQGSSAFGVVPLGANLGNPFGIAFQAADPTARVVHLDVFPTAVTTPGTINVDFAGAEPGGFVLMIADLFDAFEVGGAPPRLPEYPILTLGPSWQQNHILVADVTAGILADAEGFGRFPISITGTLPLGIGGVWMALDFTTGVVSSPTLMQTQ